MSTCVAALKNRLLTISASGFGDRQASVSGVSALRLEQKDKMI